MLLGVAFIAIFAMYLPQTLTPNFLKVERGLSLSQIGMIGSIGSIGTVTLNLVLGQINARIGFFVAQVCVGLFAVLLWRGSGLTAFGLAYMLMGGYRAARMMIFAQVRPLIHPAQMGMAYGLVETFNSLATILAPLLAGWLYTRQPESMYMAAAILIFGSILVGMRLAPQATREAPLVELPQPLER
jgi:MFS family permease